MNKTKIDWCDSTWNPVTGCLHGCEYCYARETVKRFGGWTWGYIPLHDEVVKNNLPYRVLDNPLSVERNSGKRAKAPYPYDFIPTFHRYRLNDYISKKGRNIFVCSMADLFGTWVPDNWIEEVFMVCDRAPQHNYIFLTKNPKRYVELAEKGILRCSDNMWYGWSETNNNRHGLLCFPKPINTFVSVEPILEPVRPSLEDWVIVGAETGKRKDKVIPKREWIEQVLEDCRNVDIPLFMKSSLADIWGEPLIQEFPRKLRR